MLVLTRTCPIVFNCHLNQSETCTIIWSTRHNAVTLKSRYLATSPLKRQAESITNNFLVPKLCLHKCRCTYFLTKLNKRMAANKENTTHLTLVPQSLLGSETRRAWGTMGQRKASVWSPVPGETRALVHSNHVTTLTAYKIVPGNRRVKQVFVHYNMSID